MNPCSWEPMDSNMSWGFQRGGPVIFLLPQGYRNTPVLKSLLHSTNMAPKVFKDWTGAGWASRDTRPKAMKDANGTDPSFIDTSTSTMRRHDFGCNPKDRFCMDVCHLRAEPSPVFSCWVLVAPVTGVFVFSMSGCQISLPGAKTVTTTNCTFWRCRPDGAS